MAKKEMEGEGIAGREALLASLRHTEAQLAAGAVTGIAWMPWAAPSATTLCVLGPVLEAGVLGPAMETDVLVAGGAVAHLAMLDANLGIPGAAPPSDLDVFVLTPRGADAIVAMVAGSACNNYGVQRCRFPGVVDLVDARPDRRLSTGGLPLQVIYGWMGRSPADLLSGFDMDYVCAAVRRNHHGALELGVLYGTARAWETRVTRIVNSARLWVGRLDKAAAKGFTVAAEFQAETAALRADAKLDRALHAEARARMGPVGACACVCGGGGSSSSSREALEAAFVMGARHAVLGAPKDPYGRVYVPWGSSPDPVDATVVGALLDAGSPVASAIAHRFMAALALRGPPKVP